MVRSFFSFEIIFKNKSAVIKASPEAVCLSCFGMLNSLHKKSKLKRPSFLPSNFLYRIPVSIVLFFSFGRFILFKE